MTLFRNGDKVTSDRRKVLELNRELGAPAYFIVKSKVLGFAIPYYSVKFFNNSMQKWEEYGSYMAEDELRPYVPIDITEEL